MPCSGHLRTPYSNTPPTRKKPPVARSARLLKSSRSTRSNLGDFGITSPSNALCRNTRTLAFLTTSSILCIRLLRKQRCRWKNTIFRSRPRNCAANFSKPTPRPKNWWSRPRVFFHATAFCETHALLLKRKPALTLRALTNARKRDLCSLLPICTNIRSPFSSASASASKKE